MESIVEAQEKLDAARKQLTEKTSKVKIAIIVLGVLWFLLFVRFVYLLVWQYQTKKKGSVNAAANLGTGDIPSLDYGMGNTEVSNQRQSFVPDSNDSAGNGSNSRTETGFAPYSDYSIEDANISRQEMDFARPNGYETDEAAYQGQIQDAASEATVPLLQSGNETVILRNYAGSNDGSFAGGGAFRNRKSIARLLHERTRQLITIDKVEYTIGKSSEAADFAITNNPAISRKHALVRWKNDAYYLFDLNSANGTFVNGKKIDGTGIKLTNQDKVVLADEAFEFKLE